MKVIVRMEIVIEDDRGNALISDSVDDHVFFEDKWSVLTILEQIKERAGRMFDAMLKVI